MSAHWSSPWRTAGPNGSLEIISGRIVWFFGSLKVERVAARPDASVVYTSPRPDR